MNKYKDRLEIAVGGFGGHRLAYVDAIVAHAQVEDLGTVTIVTDPAAEASAEFAQHMAHHVASGAIVVRAEPGLETLRGCIGYLRGARARRAAVVLPDSDRLLPAVALAWSMRRLPHVVVAVGMRPPVGGIGGIRGRAVPLAKTAVMLVLLGLANRSVDLQLLEDPLASGTDRVWRRWPFSLQRLRLDDPWDLLGEVDGALPPEIAGLASCPYLAVVGAIDARKRLPLILEGWRRSAHSSSHRLVVAGKWSPAAASQMLHESIPDDVLIVNRYLSNSEVTGVLQGARALFVLHDGGLSSGILTAAIANGRPVIAGSKTRTGRVACSHGLGIVCELQVDDVARAINAAWAQEPQSGRAIPGGRGAFGHQILRRLLV